LRRGVYRGEPDTIHSQITKHVKLGHYSAEISDTVSIGIAKAFTVNLIYYGFMPPFLFHTKILSQPVFLLAKQY
jgi:hypothetical protein